MPHPMRGPRSRTAPGPISILQDESLNRAALALLRSEDSPAQASQLSPTRWRRSWCPVPGAVVLRSDVERKTLFGRDEHEKLPQDAYSPRMTARVYAAMIDKARRAVVAGHSAIVDAVFARAQERAAAAASAQTLGAPFDGLFPLSTSELFASRSAG